MCLFINLIMVLVNWTSQLQGLKVMVLGVQEHHNNVIIPLVKVGGFFVLSCILFPF